jgi:hypothetical protein
MFTTQLWMNFNWVWVPFHLSNLSSKWKLLLLVGVHWVPFAVKQKLLLWFRRAWVTWHPHQCTIQNIPFWDFMDGWNCPPGSVYLVSSVFSSAFFFPLLLFFYWAFCFFFWVPPPLNQFFFWKLLPTPPTYLPPIHPPTHLPPLTFPYLPHHPFALPSITRAWEPQRIWQRACGACGDHVKIGELGELVELGAWNIKRSPRFESKCFKN